MALSHIARETKRHSSFLDTKAYDGMKVINDFFGLSKNQQINEALLQDYLPRKTNEMVKLRKQHNTLQSLNNRI